MTKIKAVLDQETWVQVDVPDEFQAIVMSLFSSEALVSGSTDDIQGNMTTYSEVVTSNDSTIIAPSGPQNSHHQIERTDSSEVISSNPAQVNSPSAEANEKNKVDATSSSVQTNSSNMKECRKSTSQTLSYGGVGYHMVNCGLILLKMLSEYTDMNNVLPALSAEAVHRVVEILKFFNTRTCQLVLGAGAMQDYKVHQDEIHTKLVQIMRERLLVHLRGLPQIVESWNRPDDSQPSQLARSLTKRVLSRILHEVDVQAIFRISFCMQVVIIFHSQISESFSRLEISSPQAKERLHRDIKHIIACIRSLPSDNSSNSGIPNWGKLDEFLVQRFGEEAG
ncbi:hypothetical protein ACOSQ3_019625 [Xanthoceras sorbifolium]